MSSPELYPHGSAKHYARPGGPIWLERSWVEQDVAARSGSSPYTFQAYRQAFGASVAGTTNELVEARLCSNASGPDPLDDLVSAAPEAVGNWMRRKAELADGTRPGIPCAAATAVLRAWERRAARHPGWSLARHQTHVDVWPAMAVSLLRDLAGLSWAEIRRRTSATETPIQRRYETHRAWMEQKAEYVLAVGELAREGLLG